MSIESTQTARWAAVDHQRFVQRLREACNGHPHAKIPWPHRILHEAAEEIEILRTALADAIRRPMGVIPASAEGHITNEELDRAEEHRQKFPTGGGRNYTPNSPVLTRSELSCSDWFTTRSNERQNMQLRWKKIRIDEHVPEYAIRQDGQMVDSFLVLQYRAKKTYSNGAQMFVGREWEDWQDVGFSSVNAESEASQ